MITDSGQERSGRISFIASQAEFTPKNVQTHDERVKLVFRVKVQLDNADGLFKPGMPAEEASTAFERFSRADSSRTRQSGGAGLGLPDLHRHAVRLAGWLPHWDGSARTIFSLWASICRS